MTDEEREEQETCLACGGSGLTPHDCGEDTCCCEDPSDEECMACDGLGYVSLPQQVISPADPQ